MTMYTDYYVHTYPFNSELHLKFESKCLLKTSCTSVSCYPSMYLRSFSLFHSFIHSRCRTHFSYLSWDVLHSLLIYNPPLPFWIGFTICMYVCIRLCARIPSCVLISSQIFVSVLCYSIHFSICNLVVYH